MAQVVDAGDALDSAVGGESDRRFGALGRSQQEPADQGQDSAWDPQIATRRDALVGTLEARLDTAQRMAVRTGELAAPRDPTHLAAELVGPLLYWTLLKNVPVPEPVIDDLVDRAFRADPGPDRPPQDRPRLSAQRARSPDETSPPAMPP